MDKFILFAGNHPVLVTALMASFFLVIFSELRRKASGLINIEPADVVRLINNDGVVIDLRNADSYARGHIVNARNMQQDELDSRTGSLDKSKPVIAVCDNGISSTRAVNALRQQGFETVFGLKGGMNGWVQEGLPVVSGKKTKSKSAKGKSAKGKSGKDKKRG
jgi:rhodanese-related sulfurtransferase